MNTPETDEIEKHDGITIRDSVTTCGDESSSVYINVIHARQFERERDEAREKINRQANRIRYLEGATNHACGTPLSVALRERDEAREENAKLRDIANRAINYLDQSYRDGFADEASDLRYEIEQLKDETK